MFNRIIQLSTFLLIAATVFWIAQLCWVRKSDYATFRSFLDQQVQTSSQGKSAYSSASQKRQGVRKDIWYAQTDQTRLHYRIESESSTLTLVPNHQKVDLIENLQKIQCWMQDKLYTDPAHQGQMQQMRFFEANEGSYQYATQQFLAQTVALSLYRLPGHELPRTIDQKNSFLSGIARDVSFSISGKTPQFQAQHFKASLGKGEL
jgi:hypothetical protein